ncbi:hypothetical protein F8388_014295 [Cannabis sativa]|uniref:Wall-associated receptor kinase galacturonan-binding domain-containing protein n=1 Tax=Cannabis sativa TaxID=3483 RepID=A0A7J6GQH7_CANSA|nr:hypothetical protein F8388_014295 [Cannabis sativa]
MMMMQKIFLIILLILVSASSNVCVGSSCNEKCGDIEVPYPFGIDDVSCAMNEDFLLKCNRSTTHHLTLMVDGKMIEVSNINVEKATIRVVMADALSFKCYDKSGGLVELSGPKIITFNNYMTFSNTENKLMAFGCDTMIIIASTLHEHSIASGCLSFCTENFNMSSEITCSGLGCCHTPVPKHLKHFSLETTNVNNHTDIYSIQIGKIK